MTETRIGLLRALAGFAAGAAFVLAVYSVLLWPAWAPVLLIGGASALLVIVFAGIPALFFLRRHRMLSIYSAAALGGIFCLIPPIYLTITNAIDGSVTKAVDASDVLFWAQYFLLPGIIGGVIGWIVAAGFRTRAS